MNAQETDLRNGYFGKNKQESDRSFSAYAKFSEKLTFFCLDLYTYVWIWRVKNVIFSENFYVRTKWNIPWHQLFFEWFSWQDLVGKGVVEYVDVNEEETARISMTPDDLQDQEHSYCSTYTHCEIHPSMILGVCASIIPFPDHNQVMCSTKAVRVLHLFFSFYRDRNSRRTSDIVR